MRSPTAVYALLLAALAGAGPAGCAGRGRASQAPAIPPPPAVRDLGDFEGVLNRYVRIPPAHAQRVPYRTRLQSFLVAHMDRAMAEHDLGEATRALEFAVELYAPAELRAAGPAPALAGAARRLYARAARTGRTGPALLALAAAQHFGSDDTRAHAVEQWALVERWITGNATFSSDPVLRHEELESALEAVAAALPSPFVVRRLSDLYLARYGSARAALGTGAAGTVARRRAEFTGILLIRLYLRADDPRGATRALGKLELDLPTRKLVEILQRSFAPDAGPRDLLMLAEQFVPDDEDGTNLPESYERQGWAIVDNLARRVVRAHPQDPFGHLLLARVFNHRSLTAAAAAELDRVIDLDPKVHEAWAIQAALLQRLLEESSSLPLAEVRRRLARVERFHARAAKRWPDRPLRPGLPQAYLAAGRALYQAGEPDQARPLLERSVALAHPPEALDLLGTIALYERAYDDSRAMYRALAQVPAAGEAGRLRWQARAEARLAEVDRAAGDARAARTHLKNALVHLEILLDELASPAPGRGPGLRPPGAPLALAPQDVAQLHLLRGKVLILLDDPGRAMIDFGAAERIDPTSPAVYVDPLIELVKRSELAPAVAIYARAMARPDVPEDLKLYLSLWVRDLAARAGAPPVDRAEAFVRSYRGDRWTSALAAHARGVLPYDDLLARASNKGERVEAHFYEAMARWRRGDLAGARALLDRVLASGMMSFFEYDLAHGFTQRGPLARPAARLAGG